MDSLHITHVIWLDQPAWRDVSSHTVIISIILKEPKMTQRKYCLGMVATMSLHPCDWTLPQGLTMEAWAQPKQWRNRSKSRNSFATPAWTTEFSGKIMTEILGALSLSHMQSGPRLIQSCRIIHDSDRAESDNHFSSRLGFARLAATGLSRSYLRHLNAYSPEVIVNPCRVGNWEKMKFFAERGNQADQKTIKRKTPSYG